MNLFCGLSSFAVTVMLVLAVGCSNKTTSTATSTPTAATWTVIKIIDGDTVDVRSAAGTEERVRVIGIDTPERGECGFTEASTALSRITLNQQVTLVAGARDDRDRYDRILRYLDVGSTDAGLKQIEAGLAIARYDSRDGYGRHDREEVYVAADAANGHLCRVSNAAATKTALWVATKIATPTVTLAGDRPVQVFSNCTALKNVYLSGVARTGVTGNLVSGELRPFTEQPVFGDALYEANTASDRDKDGIACESQ